MNDEERIQEIKHLAQQAVKEAYYAIAIAYLSTAFSIVAIIVGVLT